MRERAITTVLALFAGAALAACEEPAELALPTADEVESAYEYSRGLEADISGNVAVLTVNQSAQQLRRGGTTWAKVGPYIFLFSEETRSLFEAYPGLAGVRVVTRVTGGSEVASAVLARDALSDVQWRRALNIAGQARRDGTRSVTLLESLVRWGEDHTDFEYNPSFTSRR
jgi:hypothetical protein